MTGDTEEKGEERGGKSAHERKRRWRRRRRRGNIKGTVSEDTYKEKRR